MSKQSIVPFGKYKGHPVEVMAADNAYCEWLRCQPWFVEKYRDVYNIIINYGGEPQDTPEHNALQARFLDDAFCEAFEKSVSPEWLKPVETVHREVEFEVGGWDVVITYPGVWVNHGKASFNIECKPCLGDDYPSVLREIKNFQSYSIPDGKFLVVGSFASSAVTLVQVRKIFAGSRIRFLMVEEIEASLSA